MSFSQKELLNYSVNMPLQNRQYKIANENFSSQASHQKYIFLSHSNKDARLAQGFVNKMRSLGIQVYFDLYDSTLSLPPSADTADKLKTKILNANHFILLATKNSVVESRWCPWEVGCADGFKVPISIAQTRDEFGQEWGAEYLQLYHSIDIRLIGGAREHVARLNPRKNNVLSIASLDSLLF